MSVDVDSLIAVLTDDHVQSDLISNYTAARIADLEKRDCIIETLQTEVQ